MVWALTSRRASYPNAEEETLITRGGYAFQYHVPFGAASRVVHRDSPRCVRRAGPTVGGRVACDEQRAGATATGRVGRDRRDGALPRRKSAENAARDHRRDGRHARGARLDEHARPR